jgi:hypothetical protein
MVTRDLAPHARTLARRHPVLAVTGPRQSGKTTFCRSEFPDHAYVSLELPDERRFAREDPRGFLARFPDGAVLDEIQRVPELTSYLQVIVDEDARAGRWILTGSQHFALSKAVSQSLAGRVALLELFPLTLAELLRFPKPPESLFETLFAGAYPRIHDKKLPPSEWLASYVATYVERDVRDVLNVGDLIAFQTFVAQAAARSGQVLNLSNLGVDAGISQPTAKSWLSVLETSYLAFRLPPFARNLRKRLIKAPKLHFLDSGILCYLLGIRTPAELVTHPLRGAVFESWVVSEVKKAHAHRGERAELSFYRDQAGLEIDLLRARASELVAIEIKSGQTSASSFFDSFEPFERALATARRAGSPTRRIVVFGGDTSQARSDVTLDSWRELARSDWPEPRRRPSKR